MTEPRSQTRLKLTEGFGGFSFDRRSEGLVLNRGEVLWVSGRFVSACQSFLDYLVGDKLSGPGTKFLDEQDVSLWPTERLCLEGVHYVPVQGKLFANLSIAEHAMLRLKAPRRQAVKQVLDCLESWLPELKPRVWTACCNLSGGQQQLAAILLATLGHPKLLVIEEPYLGIAEINRPLIDAMLNAALADGVALVLSTANDTQFQLAQPVSRLIL